MSKYTVYHSNRFDKELGKFDADFQRRVDRIEEQLKENPYLGKPLGPKWFREKKIGKYRIYFAVYENLSAVFMVGISEKKDQQKVINTVRLMLDFLEQELRNVVNKNKLT